MSHKIFVTGASGFIGTALCRELRGRYPDADLAVLLRGELSADLRDCGVRSVPGDLTKPIEFAGELLAAEWVFHLGANASFTEGEYQAVNVDATAAIVDILKRSSTLRRFVFTSTIGAVDRAPDDWCDRPLTVDTPAHPTSKYGRSKLECERLIGASGIPFTIVRPSWVYGAGMRRTSHIAVLLQAAAEGKPLSRLFFPGRVSVIHVSDMARILAEIPLHDATLGETYFADDGTPRAIGEIFEHGSRLAGKSRTVFGLPRLMTAGLKKLRRVLPFTLGCLFSDVLMCSSPWTGWESFRPRVSFADGLQDTWQYLNHREDGIHVVTGAASGIGLEFARRLTGEGRRVLLVDRAESLEETARELKQSWLQLDLSRTESVTAIMAWIAEQRTFVEGLVNCAGFGLRGPFDVENAERIDAITHVNFLIPARLCRAVLPEMKRRRTGYVVNVTSSIATSPVPGMAMYGATKAALHSLGRSLWGELRGSGVTALTLMPSGTRTGFQSAAGVKVLRDGKGLLDPARVAELGLQAARSDRPERLIGLQSRILLLVCRFLPSRFEILLWRKLMKGLR